MFWEGPNECWRGPNAKTIHLFPFAEIVVANCHIVKKLVVKGCGPVGPFDPPSGRIAVILVSRYCTF